MHRIRRSLRLGIIVGSALLVTACSGPGGGEQARPQQPAAASGLVAGPAAVPTSLTQRVPGEWEATRKRGHKKHQRNSRAHRRGFNASTLPARAVPVP
jgi:hypothetical protein